ncbi:family 43 glycosylhydrolase [Microbacterium trichothecenolyticum]|uniref:glycoside hydrolase family 43 protein n=1 Tax=Microbacterium trichothecenolyticum TaxID=69370 RepID=UPI0035BE7B17
MTSLPNDVPLYRNPIVDADVPDPDAIRVGDTFYLVCSSFNRTPGLPIHASSDLVNWELIGHALPAAHVGEWFALPRHGGGVWAPSIRHHDGVFHVVYPDPDQGILVTSAEDPAGPWSAPRTLLAGLGLIDPCPLWDDDGNAYLVHGWAASRAGRKNLVTVVPVDTGLTTALGAGVDVIDGDALPGYRTLEGPKFYKRNDWYWIFAPAGGVADGWQSVFRSRGPWGPYEERIVLAQGETPVNGPHQGAWVQTADGRDWFLHFQDRGVFGRVLHLQPMGWGDDGWPVMGRAVDGGAAEPVIEYPSPLGATQRRRSLETADEFAEGRPGPQWAWQAKPREDWIEEGGPGRLVLRAVANDTGSLRTLPQVLGQPLPGIVCDAAVRIALDGPVGARAGITVLGRGYLWVGVRMTDGGPRLVVATRIEAGLSETVVHDEALNGAGACVGISSDETGRLTVSVGEPGEQRVVHEGHQATAGQWIGAELGLFAAAPIGGESGRASFSDWSVVLRDRVPELRA